MENDKPRLSLDEQIQHLKDKGILFNIMDEDFAKQYLRYNNYYKLTSFRKNYDKHPGGENEGKYINLEFAYLVDMSIIDMRLRYRVVEMALDIEHHTKLQLLRKMDEYDEDGYQIVKDYIGSLDDRQNEYSDTGRPLVTVEKSTQYAGQVHLTKKLNTVGSPQLI